MIVWSVFTAVYKEASNRVQVALPDYGSGRVRPQDENADESHCGHLFEDAVTVRAVDCCYCLSYAFHKSHLKMLVSGCASTSATNRLREKSWCKHFAKSETLHIQRS